MRELIIKRNERAMALLGCTEQIKKCKICGELSGNVYVCLECSKFTRFERLYLIQLASIEHILNDIEETIYRKK